MNPTRVVVTGLGAVTGFGRGADRMWSALVDGRRAVAERPELTAAGLRVGPVALVPMLPLDAPDRAIAFALEAAREAIADAGLDGMRGGDGMRDGHGARSGDGARLGVVCGTTLGGIDAWLCAVRATAPAGEAPLARWGYFAPAHAIADKLGARGPVETVSVACASSNVALGTALELLREGACDVIVAGGVDALDDFVLSGFAGLKALDLGPCRPFDRDRRGLNLGEGAGFLVLESEAHARARGARVRAFLDGYGLAADAIHLTGPDREGRGAARAMRLALDDAACAAGEVGFVSTHGTGTVFNDRMEAQALHALLGPRASSTPVNSIKSALGHTLGAAGALEALACVRSLETGLVVPTAGLVELDPEIALDVVRDHARAVALDVALSTSSGFGGANAALLFRRA